MLRIKTLREEKGFSQKELASKLNTSNKNIWAYENGIAAPNIDMLIKMADLFDVSVDFLVGHEDELGNLISNSTQNEYTSEEKDLIRFYRSMTEAEKRAVFDTAKAFYENHAISKKFG